MNKEAEILKKIKSKGYWKIVIQPDTYVKDRLTLSDCKELVEKSQVRKRGWYYPHVTEPGNQYGSAYSSNNYYTSFVDFMAHIEEWRMYKSGQFVHYSSLREDWTSEILDAFRQKYVLNIIMTLYSITEVFLFISNLAQNKMYNSGVTLALELNGMCNRSLVFSDITRELHGAYECKMLEPIILEKVLNKNEAIFNYSSLSMDTTIEVFQRFNWMSNNIREILRNDQEEFLKGLM